MHTAPPTVFLDLPQWQRLLSVPKASPCLRAKPGLPCWVARLEDIHPTLPALPKVYKQDFYTVYVVTEGEIIKTHQLTSVRLGPGHLYYVRPGQLNTWQIVRPVRGYVLSFRPEFLLTSLADKRLLRTFPFLQPQTDALFSLSEPLLSDVLGLFLKMWTVFSSSEVKEGDPLVSLWLQELLYYTKRLLVQKQEDGNGCGDAPYSRGTASTTAVAATAVTGVNELLQRFQACLEQHFSSRELSIPYQKVTDYADQLHVHAGYLGEVVKQTTGKSALHLIHERMLLEAQCRLRHTNLTISEIAYLLDFQSPSYFGRFFKKKLGVTPQQYRQAVAA